MLIIISLQIVHGDTKALDCCRWSVNLLLCYPENLIGWQHLHIYPPKFEVPIPYDLSELQRLVTC